jgi:hypothetical protein
MKTSLCPTLELDQRLTLPDRGPCPMLNTLANHKYLPHNGDNITRDIALSALEDALHFAPSLAAPMVEGAISTNPDPDASYFRL